jgi:hypothetical protein
MGSSTAFSQSSQSQWYTGLNIASTGYIGEVKTYGGNNAGIFTSNDVGPNTVPAAELSAFFNGVFLPGNMNGDPTDGSGVKATFSLQGTTSLAVKYQLITNEDIGSGYDRAFVYIDGRQYTLGNNSLANTPGLSPSNSNAAGLVNATRPVALLVTGLTPGLHTVGFGVYDTEDTEVTSGLLLSRLPDVGGALAVAVDQREVLLGITQTATRDVGGRLFMLRAEADDFDAGVTTLALTTGVSDGKSTVDAKDGKEGKSIVQAPERPTVELYTAGDYGYGDRDNTIGLADFTSDTYVGSVGVEVHLNHHLTLGLAYSHIENRTDFADGIGQLRIRGDAITPYVSFAMDHFYTEALYSYSKFDDETYLTGGNATPASENHTVNLDLGYNFTYGHLVTGPIFALNYTTGNLDGYTAGGGGGTSLVAGQQSYDSLITRLGWQASYKMPTHFGAITPQIRASWDRENLDNSDTVSVGLGGIETETLNAGTGLITAGAPATATTASPDRDYLNVGAGVLMQCGSRGSLIVDYEDHLFRNSYSERFATVKIGFTF